MMKGKEIIEKVINKKFKIIKNIGKGSFGITYLGNNCFLAIGINEEVGSSVAIKLVSFFDNS